jgi:endonuclease/exonuclease/phosphatase family metal-dependent hydrolase
VSLAGDRCRDAVSLQRETQPAITWIDSSEPGQQARLREWCAMVGPVLYEPQPHRAQTGTIDRLAIVSWNTHVGGGDLDALVDAVQRGDFTRGERVDAIVLLLQEMYRHGDDVPDRATILSAVPRRIVNALHAEHARDVRRVASERGFALLYAPSMRNGAAVDDPEDRGNAIMSNLPLADPAAIELPIEHQRRVVAVATVGGRTSEGADWRLRLADVHLDTALAPWHGGPMAARARQAKALVAALTRSLSFDGPTILAGDFNTVFGDCEPAIPVLRAAFPDAPPARGGATWSGALVLRARLDYVFAKGEAGRIEVQRLPSRFGSDHNPLLSVIRFAAPAAASPAPSSRHEARARHSPPPSSAE